MKPSSLFRSLSLSLLIVLGHSTLLFGQGTAFTYQGLLNNNGSPASGSYDLQFTLFPTNATGAALAGPVTNLAVPVSNGLFTASVDFGNAYAGTSTWLELAVSTNAANTFSTLTPRQPLLPVPSAIFANSTSNLVGNLPTAQLSGTIPVTNVTGILPLAQLPPGILTNTQTAVTLSGAFTGDGSGLTNSTPLAALGPDSVPGSNAVAAMIVALAPVVPATISITNVTGILPLAQLPPGILTNTQTEVTLSGAFNGDGSGLTNSTPLAALGPNSVPGSNAVAAMIVALAPSGPGGSATNAIALNNGRGTNTTFYPNSGSANVAATVKGTLLAPIISGLGSTSDGQNGITWMAVASSNSPSTFNFTMGATPETGNLPDNVCYWGWNQTPGGASSVAGEASLFYGLEREWLGQFENYLQYRSVNSAITYRPWFYGIDRTNGIAQKIEKLDTWQVLAGPTHLYQTLFMTSNSLVISVPTAFGQSDTVTFQDNTGTPRSMFTNGYPEIGGNYFIPDGLGGLVMSSDNTRTNTQPGNMLTAGAFSVQNVGRNTNEITSFGAQMTSGDFSFTAPADLAGVQINNANGAYSTKLALGVGGVLDRTVLYCVGSSDNTPISGLSQYDTLLKSKGQLFVTTKDSNQPDLEISNRLVMVNGNFSVTGTNYGNGSGLTSLNAAQISGTLPVATLPGLTTNVSTGGITFHITNGLIMRVTSP